MKLNFREAYRRQYRDVEPDERLLAEVRELMIDRSAESAESAKSAKIIRPERKIPMFRRLCPGGAAAGLCVAVLAAPMLYPQVLENWGGGATYDVGGYNTGYKVASANLPGELNSNTRAVWDETLSGSLSADWENSQGEKLWNKDAQNENADNENADADANSVDNRVTVADSGTDGGNADGGAENADERQGGGVLTAGYHRYDGYTVYDIYDGHDGLVTQPGLVVSVRNPRPIVKVAGVTDDTDNVDDTDDSGKFVNSDETVMNPDAVNPDEYYPAAVGSEATAKTVPHDVLLANRHLSGREPAEMAGAGDMQPVADGTDGAGVSRESRESREMGTICEVELSELYALAGFGGILPKDLPEGFSPETAIMMVAADNTENVDNNSDDNTDSTENVIEVVASWTGGTGNADYITVKVRPARESDRQCLADVLRPETWDQRYYIDQLTEGQPIAERWQLVPEELWYTMQCPVFAADEISADVLAGRLLDCEDAGHYYGRFAVIYDADDGAQQLVAEYVVRVEDIAAVLAAVKSAK